MIDDNFLYSKIGMSLISAQRIEYITNQLVSHLREFDNNIYGISGEEFLSASQNANLARATLGSIFKLLKLNPTFVIEEELNDYLAKRNILVHGFWKRYLQTKSIEQIERALEFCNNFGQQSVKLESFFKGFIFFLALRHVKDRTNVGEELKKWDNDFDYFINAIVEKQ
jgi:hypothetical protein